MTSTRRTRTGVATLCLLLVTAVGACTSDDSDRADTPSPAEPTASTAATLSVSPAPLKVRITSVRGHLGAPGRARLREGVSRVVGRWMTGGFLGGEQPRRDFSAAFAAYTPGAAAQARRQRAITTNQRLGPQLTEVVPTGRVVDVSALAVGGRPVGASAQVLLVLVGARTDGTQIELTVRGELDLTPTAQGWRVFGFDLARSTGAPGAFAASLKRVRERQAEQRRLERAQGQRARERGDRDGQRQERNR